MKSKLLFTLCAVILLSACSSPTTRPPGPHLGDGSLKIVAIEPAPGSTISADTVFKVTLAYELPPGYEGSYFVMTQFATNTTGTTFSSFRHGEGNAAVDAPKGTVKLRFPMRPIVEAKQLARPVRMWFNLNIRTGAHRSEAVADAGPYWYYINQGQNILVRNRTMQRSANGAGAPQARTTIVSAM